MTRRRRSGSASVFELIVILLCGVGATLLNFWQGLSTESQIILAILGCIAILASIGAYIAFDISRKRQRAISWRRAMVAWKQSSQSGKVTEIQTARLLSSHDLEKFAAQVYTKMGYRVVHTGHTGDHGVDVRLVSPAGQVEIIQCKQWKKPVGEPDVRNLAGAMVHEKAIRGFFWAPGGFTTEAIRWAKGKSIILMDDREINRIVESVFGEGSS